ncbi:phage tail protein [Pseudosulfitobacter sp. DSM 107133]|uniref:phage tail protein n=1 Tax=Pseudosulfitobacter sp. DSM 107133 TaxID=2883100 RepID=UPI000DF470CA|nr:phage tail protein [Pseudosulfitobacter sp. DSM 107133]
MGLVLAAWSAISSTFVASAFGQFLTTTFLGRLLTSVALSALKAALIKQPKAQQPGIRTQQTQTGGITPASFVLGRYATEGQLAAPTMSHTGEGGGPNAYLTYVIELGDIPGQTLESLILDGEEVPIEGTDHADYGTPIGGRFGGQAWIKYYDGTQTSADPMLVDKYGADPDRPWTVEMVGNGICYAILTFKFKRDVFTSFPSVRFVVGGIPLYDPRKDTSVGGDGTHRWGDVSTWEVSENVAVQTYNIMRGIDLGGGHKWGGDAEAEDLPLAVWWAAMNKADLGVDLEAGGTEPQYRASYEVFVDDEPGGVIEDILRGAVGEVSEVGGVWKIRLGGPSLPIYFFTDDDVIITEDDKFAPFTSGAAPINGVNATYPDPESLWEPRDAPPRFNDTYEAEDGGQRNVGALTLSATPYPTQVQRVMRNYVEDERRFRRHTLTLPSDAVPLEPLDSVSWASERFGYEAKAFEINANVDPLLTGTPRLTLREVDPADENWSTDYELPVALVPTIVTQPTPQTVTGFAVTSWGVPNADGTDVRPALRLSWNGDQPDVRGVQWEIRIPDAALVNAGSTQDVEAGAVIISESILPATNYEVRARFVATRSTAWTPWLAASTPDLKPSLGDLGDDVAQAIADAQALADGVAADLAETEAKAQSVRDDHDALVDGFTKNNLGELEVDYVAAELAATNAETARDQSQAARDAAQNAQSAAEANADAASVSAAAAVDAKDLAETNATNAASAASAAVDAKVLAETNAANAASAASAASSSASAAEAEAIAAAASATTSAGHATTASSEADDAAGSASAAAASATVATTKAGEASTSASNAATSETNAAGSASSAASSETVAAQAGTVSESRAQRNLVGDPSFEHDLAFWAASAGATLSIETHGQSEPALSKALRFTDADDDAGAYAQPYPVGDFQGRTLRFRFKARSSDAGSFLNVGIARRPEEGGFSGSQYVSVGAVTTTFQDFEVDVIYDALPTYAIGLRWFHSGAPTGAWTEITDVHVEDVTDSLAAEASAAASATSASNAAASETAAGTQASAAQTARTGAETARSGAESAETAAATSASNAAGSESAASTSASNAATSEGNAGSSATAASNSASLASTKATEAGESATAANSSANTATTKAGEASTSASNAATSETNADGARAEAVVAQGLAVSAATTAGVYATGNLVFDPDVTDDANFSSSLGATVSVVTHGQSGVPSPTAVKVTDDDSSGGFYSTFRPVGYVEGRTYRLSALVRSNTSSGNVNLALSTNNEAGDNHISLTVSLPDTVGSTFVRVSTDVTITGRTDHNKARLRVGYSGKTSGDWVEATNLRIEDITDYSIVSGEIDDIKALTVDGGTALGVLMTQLDVNAGGVSATIAAQGSAIADLEGNASAVYTFRAKAGGSVGELELVAWDDATGGGSVITMSADTIFAKGLLSADKFAAGNSSNMLFNTDYADGLEHFAIGKNGDAGADTTLEVRAAGLTYTDGVRPTIRLFQDSGDSTGFANVYARPKKQDGTLYYHEVEPGRTYEMSVYVSSQRCTGTLYMIWRDSAGALISSDTSAFGSFFGSTTDPSSWPRRWMKATAPATAKYVDIYIQKSATTSSTTSYMYLHNWMLAQTHGDATQPQDYKPRGTTYIDGQKIITGSITAESGAIGDLAVGTLQIAGDAITVPASAYSYEYFYPASETVWDDLVSVTLNRQGYQTHIEVSGAIGADRSGGGQYGAIAQLRVVRGSTLVSPTWGQGSCFGGSRNSFTLKALDTDTGTGAATYTLQAKRTPEKINTFAPIIVWPSITVQQRKR